MREATLPSPRRDRDIPSPEIGDPDCLVLTLCADGGEPPTAGRWGLLLGADGGTLTLEGTVVVGRTETAAAVPHETVSGTHARLSRRAPGEYFVQDLGSLNGTRVAGRRTRGRVPIQDGDLVEFGDACFRFRVIG